ncbi:methyltransferase [Intrasporangium oryzae NRRL B-24470]|uniref:Methyltransferase n=1 Tax=Intrasporangium oryzae NRRL B-24470 TaxID=1386089 RepID=W9G6Z3_9MICO|nr:methyltransferase [Intrasporangium oryzae]EWT00578.1 methyltransferase [Intrasporangium oryzae NRRL B-24470]
MAGDTEGDAQGDTEGDVAGDAAGDNTFVRGQGPWLARLGALRNVVRQELVSRQLAAHLPHGPLRVLDVGAGQGTQALRLARLGHSVTAVEPDARMRRAFEEAAATLTPAQRDHVTLLAGDLAGLASVTSPTAYDVVMCHGVLMYLPEARSAVAALAPRVAPGGIVSIVARNGDAMAWRPASRHDWDAALASLSEIEAAAREGRAPRYVNELGVEARADTLASLTADLEACRLEVAAWYGVRVACDSVAVDEPVPSPDVLATLLDVEERLGRTDPYRALGTLLHVVARPSG